MLIKKFKKCTVGLLSTGLLISSASLLVVACAPKQTANDTLVQMYSLPIQSWNTAYTQNTSDWIMLADIYATSLGIDEYGRTYGDVFESGYAAADGDGSIYVAQPKDTSKQNFQIWKYKIRSNAKWWNSAGDELRPIKASDYDNTAQTILNSNNGSEIALLWTTFINNASTMQTLLTAYNKYPEANDIVDIDAVKTAQNAYEKAKQMINQGDEITYYVMDELRTITPSPGGWGLITNDQNNTVEFHLNKSATFFETVLTYGPFSPIHESMIGKLVDGPANAFNGAYLPSKITGYTKTFRKNPNYYFANKTSIDKTKWVYAPKADSSTSRTLFESNTIDGFKVNQDDASGWKKYIGADANNPVSNHYYISEPTQNYSQVLTYNSVHGDLKTLDQNSLAFKHALAGSQVLQSSATRAFISSSLERWRAAKFYSSKFDQNNYSSLNTRNVFTSPGFALNSTDNNKDYVEYVKQVIADKSTSTTDTPSDYNEGIDALNEEVLSFPVDYDDDGILDNNVSRAQLINQINKFVSDNDIHKTNNKVELDFRVNPGNDQSINIYLTSMFDSFNQISNNPLKINIVRSTTADEYPGDLNASKFHLGYSAWGPVYTDPYTFLSAFQTDGGYKEYTGFDEIIDFDKIRNNLSENVSNALKTTSYEQFKQSVLSTTEQLVQVDVADYASISDRYNAFANQEYEMIYQNHLLVPLNNRNAPIEYAISKVQNYTYGHAIYGLSNLKTFTLIKNSNLLTTEQNLQIASDYKKYKAQIDQDVMLNKADNLLYN